MNQFSEWTPEETEELLHLISQNSAGSNREYANRLTEKFKRTFTAGSVKSKRRRLGKKNGSASTGKGRMVEGFKESLEITADGEYKSDKPLWMTLEQIKDPEYLLRAHGFEPDAWELITAKNNIWNTNDKVHGIQTLYGSKITVKPRTSGWTFKELVLTINEVQPVTIPINDTPYSDKRMLEIPLFDAHFGVSDYDYYKPTQVKIMEKICSRNWQEILFIVGQDMLHNDDFRGRTANGTPIESVDMVKAWKDCRAFYEVLIETSIRQSSSVKVMYSKGNHDESMSWAFVQFLTARYPQILFDDDMKERKAHTFGENFIGITHGDKARKDLHNLFPSEFPMDWAKAKNREIHTGHFHVEDGKDIFGMMVRTLATRNKTDKWHKDKGFVGAHKRFMLFEYSEGELESIHYV